MLGDKTITFSHLTAEKLPVYAAMKAIGASTGELRAMVLLQIAVVFGLGCTLAISGGAVALAALSRTTISVELTPGAGLTSQVLFRLQWIFCHPQPRRPGVWQNSWFNAILSECARMQASSCDADGA